MNAIALSLPLKNNQPENSVRICLSLGSQPLGSVMQLLRDHGYNPVSDRSDPKQLGDQADPPRENRHDILIDAEIDAYWITPFSRWLIRRSGLVSVQIRLEDPSGKIIAECNLYSPFYRAGRSNL